MRKFQLNFFLLNQYKTLQLKQKRYDKMRINRKQIKQKLIIIFNSYLQRFKMKKHITSQSTIDYRNARYQGPIDSKGNRQSLGILVDDDLSFYVSHWNDNLLDGQTLVYISHGKYIYGQWLDNQPHGLNVFRTGDTVLVGEFKNGKIVGKVLVIFQRYNIIAILQSRQQKDKFDVLECGKLLTHNELLKYIDLLDVQMPEDYYSLLKFVTSLTSDEQKSDALLACPCEGDNCYFGFVEGLAIIFNSNNGVVSVGQHQNKLLSGFGGKFDGMKIEEGNFENDQTITYQKNRPDNQIYAIFQKMHKRSLNFKNQYFDSKVKTLGDLQNLLRGNIQKIINHNIKNGIKEATVQDLNDSLDYQNIQNYESIKTAQNRQNMYEKEPKNMKKTTSQYYRQNKCFSKSSKPYPTDNNSRRPNRSYTEIQSQAQSQVQETARRTPVKDSSVYYAKKSPIRYTEEDREVFGKQSKNCEKPIERYEEQSRNKRYFPQSFQRDESKVGKTYKRTSVYERSEKPQRPERNYDRSPLNNSKNLQSKTNERQFKEKIPKFGGLEIEESQRPFHKSTVQTEVEEYKKQLQKSRSKEKSQGKSLGKCLKRPNYEDIEERRKRILNQFKELSITSSQSKVIAVSETKLNTHHKASLQIDTSGNLDITTKKSIAESPCMKEHILSMNSDTDINTQNSEQGCVPLSLVNTQKSRRNRNQNDEFRPEINSSTFSNKQLVHQRLESSQAKAGKQNLAYTSGSFTKYKKGSQDLKDINNVNDKKNQIRKFYCQESEELLDQGTMMTKKNKPHNILTQNQQEDDNQFAQIQLKHQMSQKSEAFADKKYGFGQRAIGPSRNRQQIVPQKQANSNVRESIEPNRQKNMNQQRDLSPSIVSDVSRRRTGYKYYFQG